MRTLLFKAALALALTPLFLCTSAKAQPLGGCSNATLRGDYAFTIYGQVFIPNGPTFQREGVAMTHFDGRGTVTQVDLILADPAAPPPSGVSPTDPETGFHTGEWGNYTVNKDCTGTFTIDFHYMFDPVTKLPVTDQVIVASFVIADVGRTIHTIVTSLTPAGKPGPVPVLIHSDGTKLELL
ncbi:MAG: hypothetical protein ACRD3Q_00995 [Terriglobales bacterium]